MISRHLIWILLSTLAAGCAMEAEADEPEPAASVEQPIMGGVPTRGRPEIGQFFRRGWGCTATLIAPRYAITAAHCLNEHDFQDTAVEESDAFVLDTAAGSRTFRVSRYYSFGSHFTEKIWNGYSSDVALIRLREEVPPTLATPVALADARPTGGGDWSTRFGYGCTDRGSKVGGGVKRYFPYQGQNSNVLCFGDSGGPTLLGAGIDAAPLWAINSGFSWNLFRGGYHDVDADATYLKKQIIGVIHDWEDDLEVGIDRWGADFAYRPAASAAECSAACTADSRCRAWTLYRGSCALKDAVPVWSPLTGAVSGLSPRRSDGTEVGYDRGGEPYAHHAVTTDSECTQRCATDSRCQAFVVGASGCWLKEAALQPFRRPGARAAAKRGLDMNTDRSGAVLRRFAYGTPSPETCQSECARDGGCAAWSYIGPANGRSPECTLLRSAGSPLPRPGVVSGVKGREFF